MARKGPKEWRPRKKIRAPSTPEGLALERWLQGVTIIYGEGEIDLGFRGPVYVAIVHEGGSYVPASAIVVGQNPYRDLSNALIEKGFEVMEDRAMKDEAYVKELQEEWGDRWNEILTEDFGGRVWTFKDPLEAAAAVNTDKRAMQFVDIREREE